MFKNIFSRRAEEIVDFAVTTQENLMESFSDTELYEFISLQEAVMTNAVIENCRYAYIGEREDSMEIVQESTTDFLDKIVDFFKRLLSKIKEWFGKIFLLIQTLIGNTGKILEQNKGAFLKKKATFDIDGYEYSIKDSAPNMEPVDRIIAEYNREISKVKDITTPEINERRESFKGSIHKLRGEILTSGESIDGGELKERSDAFFRKGNDTTSTITVDNAYIQRIASDYSGIKKSYNESVKQKRQLEVQLESLKKFFENGARQVKYDSQGDKVITTSNIERKGSQVSRTGEETSQLATTKTLSHLNTYFNFKYEEAKEVSNIVILVLESKVRALKEQLKFYDVCVRKWITVAPGTSAGKLEDKGGSNNE